MSNEIFIPKLNEVPLIFDSNRPSANNLSNTNLKNESDELRSLIEQTAQKLLYQWQNCEIRFPPSLSGLCDDVKEDTDIKTRLSAFKLDNLFRLPHDDELEELAVDFDGKRKRLSKEQLNSIWKTGEFDVPSLNFPGQTHKWRLTKLLQVGTERSNNDFYNMLSIALKLVIITAKRRFTSNYFSIKAGFKSIWKGIVKLFDILIGLPSMDIVPYDLDAEERKFLISELKIDDGEKEKFDAFCVKLIEYLEKDDKKNVPKFDLPCFFRTEDNLLIDLRLFNDSLMEKALPIVGKILLLKTEDDREWLKKLKKELIESHDQENLSKSEKSTKISKTLYGNYLKRCFDKILANNQLEDISHGLGKLLVDHARATLIISEVSLELQNALQTRIDNYCEYLTKNHPIKSNIRQWMDEKLAEERLSFEKTNLYMAHELAIERLQKNELHQWAYFLSRELKFRQTEESKLKKQFEAIKQPTYTFTFSRKIWMPRNYIVHKNIPNQDPIRIRPVLIENTFVSKNSGSYTLQKSIKYTNTTRYPFWRWSNIILRGFTSLSNAFFLFGIVIPFCSSISYSTVWKVNPIHPDLDINQENGKLARKFRPKFQTLISRIRSLWSNVSDSIEKFEQTPDRGLIGKSVQRVFNRIWNYVFKGFIGTLGCILIIPVSSIVLSTLSILIALLSPIWVPLLSIFGYLVTALIWDFDAPFRSFSSRLSALSNIFLWKFLICGIAQPIAALFSSILVLPISSFAVTIIACIRRFFRATWDTFMFYSIIKPQARVPSSNTFVAVRRSGPGLASNYFYQAKPEQILAAVEFKIEQNMLNSYVNHVCGLIQKPLEDYELFFNRMLIPFSYTLDTNVQSTYAKMRAKHLNWVNIYEQIASKRKSILQSALSHTSLQSIRLKSNDLTTIISKTADILKKQTENFILPYRGISTKKFFDELKLDENDWQTYSEIFLEDIFGEGILTPIEETDIYFSLDVNHLNLTRYTEMIAKAEPRDDLDSFRQDYKPESKFLNITEPREEPKLFDPSYDYSYGSIGTAKVNNPSHIVSHPGLLSVLIHNKFNQKKIEYSKASGLFRF